MTVNEMQIFENPEFGAIRTLEPGNPTEALRRLDADERTLVSIEGERRKQKNA